jgi:hypothetical protein
MGGPQIFPVCEARKCDAEDVGDHQQERDIGDRLVHLLEEQLRSSLARCWVRPLDLGNEPGHWTFAAIRCEVAHAGQRRRRDDRSTSGHDRRDSVSALRCFQTSSLWQSAPHCVCTLTSRGRGPGIRKHLLHWCARWLPAANDRRSDHH